MIWRQANITISLTDPFTLGWQLEPTDVGCYLVGTIPAASPHAVGGESPFWRLIKEVEHELQDELAGGFRGSGRIPSLEMTIEQAIIGHLAGGIHDITLDPDDLSFGRGTESAGAGIHHELASLHDREEQEREGEQDGPDSHSWRNQRSCCSTITSHSNRQSSDRVN